MQPVGRPLGAVPRSGGRVAFRVWAPGVHAVAVRVGGDDHDDHPLAREEDGFWAAEAPAATSDDYRYVLDGDAYADPCSRFQPEGMRGPSRVVDPTTFAWTDDGWDGVALDDLVLYELHVGTFSPEGTFDGVVPRLRDLVELGVTALELMPVATFPGNRGWGYDGLYAYAPHPAYGGPDGLRRLVDAAHEHGLAVILDVVYNHVGPGGGEALAAFGPYFTDRHETPWGDALDFTQTGVRAWAVENALLWIRDYHLDGLRLDAVFAIHDEESGEHVLHELARRVHEENPRALVIAEQEPGNLRPIEEWGHDAQWADEFHHELHVALTGERHGYYARHAGTPSALARQLEREPALRLVYCSQNHDQVGNRPAGDRPAAGELRIRAALTLFAPQTPLLFQGEEYGERRPFQYFTDHVDPFFAEATREGRRREFAFRGDVPDPQAEETFERSQLDPSAGDDELRAFYRRLLELRRRLPRVMTTDADDETGTLRLTRGPVTLTANLRTRTVEIEE